MNTSKGNALPLHDIAVPIAKRKGISSKTAIFVTSSILFVLASLAAIFFITHPGSNADAGLLRPPPFSQIEADPRWKQFDDAGNCSP